MISPDAWTSALISGERLFSVSQDARKNPRIAPTMQNCYDEKRSFFWCVHDEIVVHVPETQRSRSQVAASMTLVGNLSEILNCCEDVVADAIGRVDAVLSDEVPDLVEVDFGFWMKPEFGHSRAARRSSLLRRRRSKTSSPLIGLTWPLSISS